MRCVIDKTALQTALQRIVGVVDKKQAMAILSHVLLRVHSHHVDLLGTDTELQLTTQLPLTEPAQSGQLTVSIRKLLDVCRALPDGSTMQLACDADEPLRITTPHSEFVLKTLPAEGFPYADPESVTHEFQMDSTDLRHLLYSTAFSMAQQDVRYYLNGMLWQLAPDCITAVCTDGHRLAWCTAACPSLNTHTQVLLPRKAVLELMRLLEDAQPLTLVLGEKTVQIKTQAFALTCQLIEGKFPDYQAVLPQQADKTLVLSRGSCKQALQQVAVLAQDKNTGVRFYLKQNELNLSIISSEKEQVETKLSVDYTGPTLDLGFNVNYLLDVLNHLEDEQVIFSLTDATSSILLQPQKNSDAYRYVVMPMRL